MLTYKKLDSETYYITDGKKYTNLHIHKIKSIKLYCADIAQFYFEAHKIEQIKDKISQNWDKMELFEI
jgi:hypothetical protein